MKKLRISIEWNYATTCALFKYLAMPWTEAPAYAQLHSIQDLYRLHYLEELSCFFVWKSKVELLQCVVTGWVH
jgi:hypothetical protein